MSKYDIPTQKTICPACAVKSVHRLIFENKVVRHLRCDACKAAHVCAMKGSFQSAIHPKAFDEVVSDSGVDEAEAYSIRNAYHPTDVFSHPNFGVGYVFAILSPPQKMEVLFADKVRFLVCGPGSGVPEPEPDPDAEEEIGGEEIADETGNVLAAEHPPEADVLAGGGAGEPSV